MIFYRITILIHVILYSPHQQEYNGEGRFPQYHGECITQGPPNSRWFAGIHRIKKIFITGLRFFCVFIAIFIDIEPVQTLVHDTPRNSICKIFILLQAFMVIEFFCQVMPDFMREDKFNLFVLLVTMIWWLISGSTLTFFSDPFLSPAFSGEFFFKFVRFKLRDKSQYHIFPCNFIVFFPDFTL